MEWTPDGQQVLQDSEVKPHAAFAQDFCLSAACYNGRQVRMDARAQHLV